jgi:hypothetical protein|nr:MAG TPA: hypothetical protein [Caudoviricetes sp.]
MRHGEDYAHMTEMIRRIYQDVDILRLKMVTMSDYMGVNAHRDEVKELSSSLATASQICRDVYIDLIKLEMEDREDFSNGNSK